MKPEKQENIDDYDKHIEIGVPKDWIPDQIQKIE
jgi:hypothetical protein